MPGYRYWRKVARARRKRGDKRGAREAALIAWRARKWKQY